MELIVLALLGLITFGGGEGQKQKHLVCPTPIVQDGKVVMIEGDCEDAMIVNPEPPPPCEDCGPPPCEDCGPPNPDPKKIKTDNSDANGKGGNKHDRADKDKPAQEIAEIKKGVE